MDITELNDALTFIEDKNNYYAMFGHVIDTCARAHAIKSALWNVGAINDVELFHISERIDTARQLAINTNKKWVKKRLEDSKSIHTIESLTESIYNVIFG